MLLTLSQNSMIDLLKRNYETTPLNLKSQLEKQINKFWERFECAIGNVCLDMQRFFVLRSGVLFCPCIDAVALNEHYTVVLIAFVCFGHFLWHRFRWLKEVFLLADKSGDGLLSVDEVFSLMHKLNVKISNRKLREAFKVCIFLQLQ